jgi:D-beta-D-heptose 7-phosphate kinase / D-beta-D-heptose 1-phosphate adenosyltransferase
MLDPQQCQHIIAAFRSKRVLVIGDLILDVFVKGSSTRLCPEAPVPVVDVSSRTACIGGAGNAALNISLLGANTTFCTVIGEDAAGDEALTLMKNFKNNRESIFRSASRDTIVKTRVVAGAQVITRFDIGTTSTIPDEIASDIAQFLDKHYATFDAVVIADYDKGMISKRLLQVIAKLQAKYKKFLAVDSKRLAFFSELNPSLVKPNYEEAVKLLNAGHQLDDRIAQMTNASEALTAITQAKLIALTMDHDGSLIIENGAVVHGAKAPSVRAPQVSGAGDTYLAAFTLCYICSKDIPLSANIATQAASLAIRKESTATCSEIELKCHFAMMIKYIHDYDDLRQVCLTYRDNDKRIVFTNGCFDILHSGHVAYLQGAKELGDILIVGVNTDESIERLKGPSRPINPLSDRLRVLSGMADVDHVVTFGNTIDGDRPMNLINTIRPDVFVKGGDYRKSELPELAMLKSLGADVVILPRIPDKSTTDIINRIHHPPQELNSMVS